MSLSSVLSSGATPSNVGIALLITVFFALLSRIFYMQYLHPLAKFPGPWYATSFSIVGAIISIKKKEPEFFMYLVKKYGSEFTLLPCYTRNLCYRPVLVLAINYLVSHSVQPRHS
jgi:hypothetical protein